MQINGLIVIYMLAEAGTYSQLGQLYHLCYVQYQMILSSPTNQEHVLSLHGLTMLNSAVSSVQHQITLR
jgi:hypothetical protein